MPTMQPRYYEDRYPLGRFILDRANTLGFTRRQLVERVGFCERPAKGHQVLSEILLTGTVPRYCTNLADALEVDQSFSDEILFATARQQEAEWQRDLIGEEEVYRAEFRPHIQIQTERSVPSPIFVAALLTVERLKIVRLPEAFVSAEQHERDETVRAAIIQHYSESSGRVPAFGGVTGYIVVRTAGFGGVDSGLPYGCEGSAIGPMVSVRRLPHATLGVKKGDTRLTGLLRNTPIRMVGAAKDSS